MATLEVQPLVLKDVELIFGDPLADDDFRKHASSVTLTPSAEQATWNGLGKNSHTDTATATWTCVIEYVQDWDSADSLSRYLFTNEGTTVQVHFRPRAGTGPSFTANVTITPGAIGGAVNAFATTSVTLGSDKPQLVPAA